MMTKEEYNPYGGTKTVISSLPVGTKFYVCNGAWRGSIVMKDGVKQLQIGTGKYASYQKFEGEYKNHPLWIDIEEEGK
ncbi:hypothetical protein BI001_gp180 [Bacillus phage Zuko]|uniref:hypothetical protein n=1 Tax=Bacillus phage Zuko TaxID=1805956 RepID=UPI0007A76AEA|nr:hypothetical protein BI001_gp180 [Bacillus phage Zuko]AMW62576.1 hypothetical protein ZUKO_198 [Bacillus phage Zuko]